MNAVTLLASASLISPTVCCYIFIASRLPLSGIIFKYFSPLFLNISRVNQIFGMPQSTETKSVVSAMRCSSLEAIAAAAEETSAPGVRFMSTIIRKDGHVEVSVHQIEG